MDPGKTKVLLVERDDARAQALGRQLVQTGHVVHRVCWGEEAAQAVRSGTPEIDLIMIDAAVGNGLARSEVAGALLENGQVPVVSLAQRASGDAPAVVPEFKCDGIVDREADPAVLDASLQAVRSAFEEKLALRRRMGQLERAAAQARLGVWEYEREGDGFTGSRAVHEAFGLDATDVPDLERISQMYAPATSEMLMRAVRLALEDGKPFSFVTEIQTPAGQHRWVRTQGSVAQEAGSGASRVLGTVQDISEIRLLDRVMRDSAMTLDQVEEITHIGHWSVSLTDGSFFHSDEVKRIFGYEPSEYALSVEEAIEAYHPEDRAEVVRLFNRAVETGQGYEFDLRIVQPSGDIRHVHAKGYTEKDDSGKVTRVYGVFQDITERVLAERALRESEASMKALVDGVHTAIVVHGPNGEILLSNQMANRLLAPLATEVVGKDLSDPAWRFFFEDGRPVGIDELPVSTVLRTKEPIENLVLGRRDGEGFAWLLVNGVPVVDKGGDITRVIISFVDITEHKEMEERLHQSEKMRAIGQLAGGVAHDFNNQLMVMLNFAELLKESLDPESIEQSFVDRILWGISRSSELTKQLLAFARKGKYVVTTVDINKLIAEVTSMVSHSFDKRIRITRQLDADPASVVGDVSQLQNALLNMALSARDAMPAGGELAFRTELAMLDERFLAEAGLELSPGPHVRVAISDTGIGMDEGTRKHIFEPFFTTKLQGKGTGMGMASVYGTVKNHHGAIDVQSEPGSGTTITMFFPLAAVEGHDAEEPALTEQRGGGRILVVDDEEGVATSVSMVLSRKGYEVVTCASGRDAVEEFRKSWRHTDLVLLDVIMPEVSGSEVFRALKAIDPGVKVILMSGYSFTDEAKKIISEGAASFLLKPVGAKELLGKITESLGNEQP
ncbi:MAG: PAS domain-containing protein [Myxococcales bacterium]|nr:PAS domain-containing protein [Myxococcales bacterium]